jgi:hypothetical protein
LAKQWHIKNSNRVFQFYVSPIEPKSVLVSDSNSNVPSFFDGKHKPENCSVLSSSENLFSNLNLAPNFLQDNTISETIFFPNHLINGKIENESDSESFIYLQELKEGNSPNQREILILNASETFSTDVISFDSITDSVPSMILPTDKSDIDSLPTMILPKDNFENHINEPFEGNSQTSHYPDNSL